MMTTLPDEAISPALTNVYVALIHVFERDGRVTVRTVAEAAERGVSATHKALERLRDAGLIDWEQGRSGTLRPVFRRASEVCPG
jgi:predicted transcriptional regulator